MKELGVGSCPGSLDGGNATEDAELEFSPSDWVGCSGGRCIAAAGAAMSAGKEITLPLSDW
jgi:hypothetical protein